MTDNATIFDRATVFDSLGGDLELYFEIIDLFISHYPGQIESVKAELAAGNTEQIGRIAHSIKGAVSNFAAVRATEAARTLELAMKSGDTTHSTELVNEMIAAVDELGAALAAEKQNQG